MSSDQAPAPEVIDSYLNPDYWDGRYLGDGNTEPWPEMSRPAFRDMYAALQQLGEYVDRGAPMVAISRLSTGQTFDAADYPACTILLTQVESMQRNSSSPVIPMPQFADVELPNRRTNLSDGQRRLSGHGYAYNTHPLINVIAGLGKTATVYVCPYDKVRPQMPNKELAGLIVPGVKQFTVGETYNFVEADKSTIIRVNELIVCMNGRRSKGVTTRAEAEPTAAPRLAIDGGYA